MFSKASWIALMISFVSCIHFARSQNEPKISHISHEQVRDRGGTVMLNCSVVNAESYYVVWMKTDRLKAFSSLPLSSNDQLTFRNPRFSLSHDKMSSTYRLQIKDIQESDAGVYQCKIVVDTEQMISAEVDLQVRRPPLISENSTKSIHAKEGQTTHLECLASGYPPPKISWKRDNNAILPAGRLTYKENTLRIQSVNRTDRGVYFCIAENGVSPNATRRMTVEVEFKPVIVITQPRVGQSLKYDMDLECRVEAHPSPVITWYKDGAPLVSNEHYSISQTAKATEYTEYTDSTLRILSIEKHQYGRYQCKASNKLGTADEYVELFETSTPNINYRGVLYSSGTRITLLCPIATWFLFSGLLLKVVSSL